MAYVIGDDCIACGTCIGECPVEATLISAQSAVHAQAYVLRRLSALLNKDKHNSRLNGWEHCSQPFFFVLGIPHQLSPPPHREGRDVLFHKRGM